MDLREKTINTLRILSADMVQKANSGHPGAPMGMAPMAYALWMHSMRHSPKDPAWKNRDRFILSNGHAGALLYSLLHLCGYNITMEDIKQFRQWGSHTPGHPEYDLSRGIETTTGPLGQGFSNAVGMAIAETMLAEHFNREGFPIVDHKVYCFMGDGCMMEGIASEAASLAGTLKLNKLVALYDDNEISIEGSTDIAFKEDVGKRFEAYGWQVIKVKDGNDAGQVIEALEKAQSAERPTLIVCPTIIGYGSAAKQGNASAHGEPLGEENLTQAREALGMGAEPFHVSAEVLSHVQELMEKKDHLRAEWEDLFSRYAAQYPELAKEWDAWHSPLDQEALLSNASLWEVKGKEATRASSGNMINKLAKLIPNLVGGSADLAPSNKTYLNGAGDYSAENRAGRNLHFGVREHAMAAICNGMALHGGLHVYCGTFFVFSDYMKGAMRLSAIMGLPVTYVLTHDSIGVGEDGATHEPIEQLAALRATPGMRVIRPCDAKETAAAWITALTSEGPTALVLTRQGLEQFEETGKSAMKGAYVLRDSDKEPEVLLMASGSEAALVVAAQEALNREGIAARAVCMPSMEMFLQQPKSYQDEVLPPHVRKRVAVEAGASMPWYRFVGLDGVVIGIDRFGASAPAARLFTEFGFTAENVIKKAKELLGK